jgi:hypothetical protein
MRTRATAKFERGLAERGIFFSIEQVSSGLRSHRRTAARCGWKPPMLIRGPGALVARFGSLFLDVSVGLSKARGVTILVKFRTRRIFTSTTELRQPRRVSLSEA